MMFPLGELLTRTLNRLVNVYIIIWYMMIYYSNALQVNDNIWIYANGIYCDADIIFGS